MQRNRYIAIVLLALISVKSLIVPAIYVDFEIRKDFIIKNLCENRFKPQLKCDGSCYLAKKMNAVAEEKATNETQKHSHHLKKVMEQIYDINENSEISLFSQKLKTNQNFLSLFTIPNGNYLSVFHPPTI
jgi:hypothetical protein